MTLASDFAAQQKPVIMVELDFPSASINFWTRPFTGTYDGKTYRPLGGVTGSLSVRQSLERQSLDASAQITGPSQEIKAAALTEQFQLRPARIKLGSINAAGDVQSAEEILTGKMQDITLTDDTTDGVVSTVRIDSIFAELSKPRDLRMSAADQAAFNPDDSFFDLVETAEVLEPRFGA